MTRQQLWRLFERDASSYEAWYDTRRGQRADRAERALLEHLLAPFGAADSAVEIGCGTGHFTRWLAGRLTHVIGLDRAPAMLAEARRTHPGMTLVLGDAHRLPLQDRAVDLGIFVATLEFVERPAAALAEAVRVARRGVCVAALNRWSRGGFSRRWGRDAHGVLRGRARDLTLPSLRAIAATAAGARLRGIRWTSGLFPSSLIPEPARIPLGDVIGIALDLEP